MKISKRLFLFLVIVALLVSSGCRREVPPPPGEDPQAERINPEDMILTAEAWQDEYPLIYESFIRTARLQDNKVEDTGLGGMHPIDYLKKYPDIKILYEGMGFAKEYYIARGHFYALDDVINTERSKPGASCLACKTSEYEKLFYTYEDEVHARDFQKTSQEVKNSISCYNCHRNEPSKGIQLTAQHFIAGLDKLDKAPKEGTQACAQCHVEYYIDSETKEVVLPWDNGIGVDDIEAFYDERDYADWTHPVTGTPLIKVQHPEFEMYTGSIHNSLGITCADCHMPVIEENQEKYISHWAKSPLKTVEESCSKCHGSDTDKLIVDVQQGQLEIEDLQAEVSNLLVKLIVDFGEALENQKLDDESIDTLRSLHRRAQYRWDFVFVENSSGFHDFKKARETLQEAKEFVQEALDLMASKE